MSRRRKARMQGKVEHPEKKAEKAPADAAPADDSKTAKISTASFACGGVLAGVASYFTGADYGLPTGVIILFILSSIVTRLAGKKKLGMWAAGGIFLYLFAWLDVWVVLYNYL